MTGLEPATSLNRALTTWATLNTNIEVRDFLNVLLFWRHYRSSDYTNDQVNIVIKRKFLTRTHAETGDNTTRGYYWHCIIPIWRNEPFQVCGEKGIWTPDTFRYACFQDKCIKPDSAISPS